MRTQLKAFVSTVLLFSLLLQSCGHPGLHMVEPTASEREAAASIAKQPPLSQPREKAKESDEATTALAGSLSINGSHDHEKNHKNDCANTPLHLAAMPGHKVEVERLLSKNVEVNAKNEDGYTPCILQQKMVMVPLSNDFSSVWGSVSR